MGIETISIYPNQHIKNTIHFPFSPCDITYKISVWYTDVGVASFIIVNADMALRKQQRKAVKKVSHLDPSPWHLLKNVITRNLNQAYTDCQDVKIDWILTWVIWYILWQHESLEKRHIGLGLVFMASPTLCQLFYRCYRRAVNSLWTVLGSENINATQTNSKIIW